MADIWSMFYSKTAEMWLMLCPVKHPMGHWFGHQTNELAIAQWLLLVGVGIVIAFRVNVKKGDN